MTMTLSSGTDILSARRRHLGFYYFAVDPCPQEAMRQLGHSLALREKLGDPNRSSEL